MDPVECAILSVLFLINSCVYMYIVYSFSPERYMSFVWSGRSGGCWLWCGVEYSARCTSSTTKAKLHRESSYEYKQNTT